MSEARLFEVISKLGGEEAVKIARQLKKMGRATEDDITKATGVNLNEVRKILFKLRSFSLVSSESVQDKNSGWLIYYWMLQPDRLESLIRSQKKRVLEKLEEKLAYEKSHDFYRCVNGPCGKVTFEEAVESFFRCPKCGGPVEHFDNTAVLETLEREIRKLKEEMERE